MGKKLFVLGAAALTVAAGSYAVTRLRTDHALVWANTTQSRIQVDPVVDLGVVETGQTATGTFAVANRGGSVLNLSHVRTECGCLGALLVAADGSRQPFTGARIPPGGQINLEMHFLVRGETGQPTFQNLKFACNDPDQPEIQIACRAVPGGAVMATPSVLALGTFNPGQVSHHVLEIRDDRRLGGCEVTKVESSNPAAVVVAYSPAGPNVTGEARNHRLGRFVGRVEVALTAPPNATNLAEQIRVYFAGKEGPALSIPVNAQIVPRYELLPAEVRLPRASSQGPSYTARVLCRGPSGTAFKLNPITVPVGLTVTVAEDQSDEAVKLITIQALAGDPTGGRTVTHEIPLTVHEGTRTEKLVLRVIVGRPE